MSKTTTQNIEKIENMQVEKVVSGSIHLKINYLKCVNCKSQSVRRSVSAYTNKSRKSKPNPRFNCQSCSHTCDYVYSIKHDKKVDFEEYKDILKEEI